MYDVCYSFSKPLNKFEELDAQVGQGSSYLMYIWDHFLLVAQQYQQHQRLVDYIRINTKTGSFIVTQNHGNVNFNLIENPELKPTAL